MYNNSITFCFYTKIIIICEQGFYLMQTKLKLPPHLRLKIAVLIALIGTGTVSAMKSGGTTTALRFQVIGNNCIVDNSTGLTWAKNANLIGRKVWRKNDSEPYDYPAANAVEDMNKNPEALGYNLCGYKDWRLPTLGELDEMIHSVEQNDLLVSQLERLGFKVNSGYYWTATFDEDGYAWSIFMSLGEEYSVPMSQSLWVWPVRGKVTSSH